MSVRRSSPYFSFTSRSSSLMMPMRMPSSASTAFRWVISFMSSACSSRILSRSRPVRRCRRMSRMARACTSLSPKRSMRPSRATSGVSLPRIRAITSSRLSMAISRPSRMWARSSAFRRSYCVRRTTTSCRCSTKWEMRLLRSSSTGRPPASAMLFTLKLVCRAEYLNSWFSTTVAMASRFTSYTMRMPLRSLSSRMSLIPSTFLSFTRSAHFFTRSALFTMKGISSTMMVSRPRSSSSMRALPRSTTRPRPVS